MLPTEGLIFALLTAATASIYALTARYVVRGDSNPLAFSILFTVCSAIISCGLFFVVPPDFSSASWSYVPLLVCAGVLYGLYDATQFSARKHLEASSFSTILQTAPVIAFILSVLILKEGITVLKLAAVALIITGNMIAIYKSHGRITSVGLMFGLTVAAVSGIAYVVDKVTFPHIPFLLYSITVYVIPAVIVSSIYAVQGGTVGSVRAEWRQFSWRIPVISLLGVTTYYFLYRAFQVADASVVVPITSSSTILTVLGGIFLLGEKGSMVRKIIGAVFVLTGVLLLRM